MCAMRCSSQKCRDEIQAAAWDGGPSHRKLSGMYNGGGESCTLGSTMLSDWLCPVAGMFVTGMEVKATLIQVLKLT
jgi:hypothetical protein